LRLLLQKKKTNDYNVNLTLNCDMLQENMDTYIAFIDMNTSAPRFVDG